VGTNSALGWPLTKYPRDRDRGRRMVQAFRRPAMLTLKSGPAVRFSAHVSPAVEVYQNGKCTLTVRSQAPASRPIRSSSSKRPPGHVTPIENQRRRDDLKGNETIDVGRRRRNTRSTSSAPDPKPTDCKVPTTTKKFALTVKPFDARSQSAFRYRLCASTHAVAIRSSRVRNGHRPIRQGLKTAISPRTV